MSQLRALCDPKKMVMNTKFELTDWGMKCGNESIRYKWCEECAKELPK